MEYVVMVHKEWRQATGGLSLGAKGLLVTLLEETACRRGAAIPISVAAVAPHLDCTRGRESFAAWIAELKLRRLVCERRPGRFAIAPGLWTLVARDMPLLSIADDINLSRLAD